MPAAVQSHQTICIESLLGLQKTVNETLQRRHLAEDPQQSTAELRDAVAVARGALPGDFAPSSEVAAAAFQKLGTRNLPSAPKLQKDVDTFSKLCEEAKELCDAVWVEADELAREMDEGHTDVVFDPRALILSLEVSHTQLAHMRGGGGGSGGGGGGRVGSDGGGERGVAVLLLSLSTAEVAWLRRRVLF